MKKVISILLAVCLLAAMTCTAFAADDHSGAMPKPSIDVQNKYDTNASAAGSANLKFTLERLPNDDAHVLSGSGYGVVGGFSASVFSPVPGGTLVTFDTYLPEASDGDQLVAFVDGEWVLVDGANVTKNGDRVSFTVSVDLINKAHFFLIVNSFETVNVTVPQEGTEDLPDDDDANVDVNDGENVTEADTETDAPEQNPITGIAFAVVPMIFAAAAVIISKKR